MKKKLIWIVVILVALPVAYYYWIAKPSLEREKFEYQKRLDQEEKDKKAQEEYDKRVAEQERKEKYENCIRLADVQYDADLESVCNLSYDFCIDSIKNWNNTVWKYNWYKNNSECDKHKFVNWGCAFYVQLNEPRETRYKQALERCDIQYN